jgi:hypothetical protein
VKERLKILVAEDSATDQALYKVKKGGRNRVEETE